MIFNIISDKKLRKYYKRIGRDFIKNIFCIFFLWITSGVFSQQMLVKSFSSDAKSIEIFTEGLDEIKIINSDSNQIEVSLFDENPHSHHILIDEETAILKIGFKLQFLQKEDVFRKFITKRLNRASAIIKLPKDKNVTILGTNVGVISKSYNGNLNIYIDKGYINLHKVQQNIDIKLFQGNVFGVVSKSNVNIVSNNGKIEVEGVIHQKKYERTTENTTKTVSISSINANIVLMTE